MIQSAVRAFGNGITVSFKAGSPLAVDVAIVNGEYKLRAQWERKIVDFGPTIHPDVGSTRPRTKAPERLPFPLRGFRMVHRRLLRGRQIARSNEPRTRFVAVLLGHAEACHVTFESDLDPHWRLNLGPKSNLQMWCRTGIISET